MAMVKARLGRVTEAWVALSLLTLLLLLPARSHAALKVVATLPSLAALAAEVGGKGVQVDVLASPGEDPHYVDAKPNLVVKLNRADLLISNGLELEVGWLPVLQQSARNPRILPGATGFLEVSHVVRLLEVPEGRIDRSMGDIHPGGNPHFLYDARAGAAIATAIGAKLESLDPSNANLYRTNATQTSNTLLRFAAEETQHFKALKPEQRLVVTYHKSLVYLCDWLGLQPVMTVEPRPGIPPDPAQVAQVVATLRTLSTRVIFQEEFYPRGTSDTITRQVSGKVVAIAGGAKFKEGETYLAHLQAITREVYHALAQ